MVVACAPGGYDLWVYPGSYAKVTQLIKQGQEALNALGPDATEEERLQLLRDTDADVAALMQAQEPVRIHLDQGEVRLTGQFEWVPFFLGPN